MNCRISTQGAILRALKKGAAMIASRWINLTCLLTLTLLTGCSGEPSGQVSGKNVQNSVMPESEVAADTIMKVENCGEEEGISFLCGVINGEDILRLGESDWLLVSGMDGSLTGSDIRGKIHLVNAEEKTAEILFPGSAPVFAHDTSRFAECPGPIDTSAFSAHGLALKASTKGPDIYHLYMTSHGAREAIEVFEVEAFLKPTITWVGCIPMPESSWTNSVAILEDGGFVATQFFNPSEHAIENVLAGEITGHVFEWHPGQAVTMIPGTELSGGNGIVVSEDERWIFAASFGTGEVVRFERNADPVSRQAVTLDVLPDNIRWSPRGTLLAAGNNRGSDCGQPPCAVGWGVVEIAPENLTASTLASVGPDSSMHDASSALLVNGEIWVGTYSGDRLAILQMNYEM